MPEVFDMVALVVAEGREGAVLASSVEGTRRRSTAASPCAMCSFGPATHRLHPTDGSCAPRTGWVSEGDPTVSGAPVAVEIAHPKARGVPVLLDDLNLATAEQKLIQLALERASGHLGDAAALLGISRHALKRRMFKHRIARPT